MSELLAKPRRARLTSSVFGDSRLDRQYGKLTDAMATHQQAIIHQLSTQHGERIGFYRFLAHRQVNEASLLQQAQERCAQLVRDKSVLVLHDTSEMDYSYRPALRSSPFLGPIGNGKGWGYLAHVSLALDAGDASLLGLARAELWQRPLASQKPTYHTPFEQKESSRWLRACQQVGLALPQAQQLTHIQDREGDIYDTFVGLPERRHHLLIRSRTNRLVEMPSGQRGKLATYLQQQPWAGAYTLSVSGECGQRKQRQALMQVRFGWVYLLKQNQSAYQKAYPAKVKVGVIEAVEQAESVPEGEEPIHWRLLTTHPVTDWWRAVELVYFYSLRWRIEEFFRLLKSEGFRLEDSELESAQKLRKLALLAMESAVKVLQLKQAREGQSQLPIEAVFSEEEQGCLQMLQPQLQGTTHKLSNPHPPNTLAWATWIIARLGGWSGYDSQRKPGVLTLQQGLKRFDLVFIGWKMSIGRHVYKR